MVRQERQMSLRILPFRDLTIDCDECYNDSTYRSVGFGPGEQSILLAEITRGATVRTSRNAKTGLVRLTDRPQRFPFEPLTGLNG